MMNIIFLIKPKCDTAYLYTDDSVRQGLEKMYYHKYTAIPVIDHDGSIVVRLQKGIFSGTCSEKNPRQMQRCSRIFAVWNISLFRICFARILIRR